MRAHHMLGIVAALAIGFAMKLMFFPAPVAVAGPSAIQGPRMDVSRMHENKILPEQKLHDMSFVYAESN